MRLPDMFVCLILTIIFLNFHHSQAQSCKNETFSKNILYASCNSLPYLSASLHWTYHPSNGTADVAYRAPQSSDGWVGWAINPSGEGMIGANAFLAFHNKSTSALNVWTYQLKSYDFPAVQDENLSFAVFSRDTEYSGGAYTIYTTVSLPGNRTQQNIAWQSSTLFQNDLPHGHPRGDNLLSKMNLDFSSGQTSSASNSRLHRQNIHGMLNAVGWGILLPIGVMIARYGRVFKAAGPAWFYLHIACQFSGYALGVGGWSLGLKLAGESTGTSYPRHRNIGIAIFSLATLQVFALFLRPDKKHMYRLYWNLYHWSVGYTVVVLTVINVFKGLSILDPAEKWRRAYIAVIATLAGVALILEAFTWAVVLKRKRENQPEKASNGGGDADGGVNVYGAGRQA